MHPSLQFKVLHSKYYFRKIKNSLQYDSNITAVTMLIIQKTAFVSVLLDIILFSFKSVRHVKVKHCDS